MTKLNETERAYYETIIDAAQQNPGEMSLRRAEVDGFGEVAVVMIKVRRKDDPAAWDLMPLAVLLSPEGGGEAMASRMTVNGEAPFKAPPGEYLHDMGPMPEDFGAGEGA